MVEFHPSENPSPEALVPIEHLRKTLEELLAETSEGLKRVLAEKKPHLSEIALLAEYLAQLPYQRAYNSLVQAFKRYVNQALPEWKQHAEKLPPESRKTEITRLETFQKRFEDAVIRFEENRQAYERQCKENAEKARALLTELKEIVLSEQLDAFPRVRRITREWSQLRKNLLPQDRKELVPAFADFLRQFDDLYKRYKDIFEAERNSILERRKQLRSEIERLFPPEGAQTSFEFWQQQRDRLALLQSEWQSLPHLGDRVERELFQQYKQLVRRFREQYALFRSQAYQRVQKDPVLRETYARKKQLVELLRPLVEKNYASLEEWKQANQRVREYIREWRSLTQRSLAQDDSKEVRRFYAPLNQQFSELLDAFNEKSEAFNQEYRRQQIQRLAEAGKRLVQEVQKLLQKELAEAVRQYRAKVALWKRRAYRFQKEEALTEITQHIKELGEAVREAQKAYAQKLTENLEKRIHLLNEMDELSAHATPEKLEEFVQRLVAYEQVGEVSPSHRERLQNRQRQAIQRFLANSGISEEVFQEAWFSAQVAYQSPQQIKRSIESLKSQVARYKQDIQGYQNTLALLAKGKASDSLRKELEQKIAEAQTQMERTQAMIKRLQTRLHSANASSASSA
ncbi:MAG: hypothetical protein N3A68_01120 [Bacteroidia bacterium]|jgi:hypothetical protein|nr:hypothetical protein [Bacteroidia bacterium]GIV23525.1 MAG: hypothetical protein KatS3mg025_1184 [Bacteroidia bacterium]